uniref:RING-type domain-containing protein n=1 Tax=Meloidogyne enterolobii TaxID=390850 RepID=A0A6V7X9I8_MELEN|nr:unnamed protein product [Meloidogyne enterolobii]
MPVYNNDNDDFTDFQFLYKRFDQKQLYFNKIPYMKGDKYTVFSINEESNSECSICLSDIKIGETAAELDDCKHLFHGGCILPWLKTNKTCPLCRHDLTKKEQTSTNKTKIQNFFHTLF